MQSKVILLSMFANLNPKKVIINSSLNVCKLKSKKSGYKL